MDNCPYNNPDTTLAIETSGRIGSVAVGRDGALLAESTFSGFMKHSTELFGLINDLLERIQARPSDIRHLYITAGPGSFTGLRIAVTVAKMMNFTHQTKIVAADSMDVLVENASVYNKNSDQPVDCVTTILDAKRNQFYAAVFERQNDNWTKILPTQLISAEALLDWLRQSKQKKIAFLGEGLVYYANKFESPISMILDEQYWAANAAGLFAAGTKMAEQGHFADAKTLIPFYVRRPEAVENWERRQQNSQ